tara:strand:- start:864 stop:1160 length:297 start_codon:yes stop_codon:yes gene_type:complete
MKALIFENKIVDVSEQEFDVNESLTWIDCPDACVAGRWELVDGVPKEIEKPTLDYSFQRIREYPPMSDYLDGVVKNDQDQIDKYITDCLAVKNKFPKG